MRTATFLTTALSLLVLILAVAAPTATAQNLAQQPAYNPDSVQTLSSYPSALTNSYASSSGKGKDDADDGGVNPLLKGKVAPEKAFMGKCFKSEKDLKNATLECSGRGSGRESRAGGAVCWRCVCKADRREGRVTYFAGDACQKIDISGPFVLLASTTIVLMLVVGSAVGLLFRQGMEELPSTLAGVSIVSKD
ncbi:unnamed protein product [Tilletia controversa]|uniref:Vacuolar sorting protein Vps3844 C-terminal domain-containing protein n=3 Tax=Tilletia TaxID=13289 RepID=A0A8X7MQN5_9BASI|nr:hypothetical protein CF336_g5480 [Tilletia laevis]KAE8192743.1 hypothetical protein CF328_g5265 [Tilletia controversa]KAE8256821.1 hypothetical protein A4X03_0g5022 [Tilletia caries]KAE8196122.1 hypothetical protein CF335_g4935 [Tilletia laevis]KAE8243677.1 hypothetical protein A4X06_0g6156 [Tilletia controversa]